LTLGGSNHGVLRRFFTPPRFDDPARTSRARMVFWMAGTIALVTTASQLALLALHPVYFRRFLVITVVIWAVCLGDLVFVRRGRIAAAAWFQTLAVWAALTLTAWTSGGLSGPSVTAQLIVVALGGMLVGRRGGLAFVVLALATVAGLALAEAGGALPAPSVVQTPATRAVTLAAYIVVLGVVQLLILRDLQGARDRALAELEERRAAESFSDMLIDAAPAIFFLVDAEGRRLRWNRRLEELMGMDAAELTRLGPLLTIVGEDRPAVARTLAEALETGSGEIVARVGPPGEARDILLTGQRIVVGGDVCVAGFGLDITDLKRAESEVRALNDELEERVEQRTAELEEALRALEAFSYSVSHDLRTPLRAINGYATIIDSDYGSVLDDEARRLLLRVRESTQRMAQLIDDLLRFSRLGRHALVRDAVDMDALVESAIHDVLSPERLDRVALEVAELPAAWGDASLIRQVWINLLENAVKFSAKSEAPRITVSAHVDEGRQVYCVTDNGVGFDPEYGQKLFEVFERRHGDEYGGTGIGLAICRRIVEAHGGSVWCDSRPGGGSTFGFSLPRGHGPAVPG